MKYRQSGAYKDRYAETNDSSLGFSRNSPMASSAGTAGNGGRNLLPIQIFYCDG
jgi:hypothetical protein